MNNKTSDKDVTIKEDIRVLKNIEKLRRIEFKHCVTDREIKAIQNILVELEQKDKRIQELEEKLEKANKQLDLDYVDDNYIPKQKVKDKIELHKNYLLNQAITSNLTLDSHFRDRENYLMQTLQELLEGEK